MLGVGYRPFCLLSSAARSWEVSSNKETRLLTPEGKLSLSLPSLYCFYELGIPHSSILEIPVYRLLGFLGVAAPLRWFPQVRPLFHARQPQQPISETLG